MDDLYFYKGDIEKIEKIKILDGLKFDMILCIETYHCLENPEGMLSSISEYLSKSNGSLIIADIFNKSEVKEHENLLKKYFVIEKKEIISVNVKYAMQLDMPRIDKTIKDLN